jgi:hypothetical protein
MFSLRTIRNGALVVAGLCCAVALVPGTNNAIAQISGGGSGSTPCADS